MIENRIIKKMQINFICNVNHFPFLDHNYKYHLSDFPIENADVQIIRSLKNIEDKLNNMQEKQEYILKKLDDCERPRNIESSTNNFGVEEFLSIVDDLKNWDFYVFDKTSEDENSVRFLIDFIILQIVL